MHNKNGVTLVEMVIVLGIFSIISLIAYPSISGIHNQSQRFLLEVTSKELLSDLRLCQQRAMNDGCLYQFYFNENQNNYKIYKRQNTNVQLYKTKSLPDGISFDTLNSTYYTSTHYESNIEFNSRGKPVPYPCTIVIKNDLGLRIYITITVGTDYIGFKEN